MEEKFTVDKCRLITLSKNQVRWIEYGTKLLKPLLDFLNHCTVSGRMGDPNRIQLNILVLLKMSNIMLNGIDWDKNHLTLLNCWEVCQFSRFGATLERYRLNVDKLVGEWRGVKEPVEVYDSCPLRERLTDLELFVLMRRREMAIKFC